jgi:TetR/AcrR family transcriptional regulator
MPARDSARTARRARAIRGRGRPGGAAHTDAVRLELLRAARELFARRDFKSVSVRDIAGAARVNPAMVHYHFGDKLGLYRAMLEETLGPVLQRLQEMLAGPVPRSADASVRQVFTSIMTMMAHEPWVPRLVVREVLAEDGAFRSVFIREFASRGAGRLPSLIRAEVARGRMRADLDATLGALSLISLALFPFFALPITREVFGIRMTDRFVARLVEHTARLYEEGARPIAGRRDKVSAATVRRVKR